MPAVKAEHVITARKEIQAGGRSLFNRYAVFSTVFYDSASCDNIRLLQNAVQKRHPHAAYLIFQINRKRLRLPTVSIDCRKSRQSILFIFRLMTDIA